MDGGTGPIHTLVVGLAQRPGVDVGDGWKQVSGTFVAQAPSSFKAIRFFAGSITTEPSSATRPIS